MISSIMKIVNAAISLTAFGFIALVILDETKPLAVSGVKNLFADPVVQPYTGREADPLERTYLKPEDQVTFLTIVLEARARFMDEESEIRRGELRRERAERLCRTFETRHFNPWVGTLQKADVASNGQYFTGLQIGLTDSVTIEDVRNFRPEGTLYAKLRDLKPGDTVLVSGELVYDGRNEREGNDCFNETSLTLNGGMTRPAYRARIHDIALYVE